MTVNAKTRKSGALKSPAGCKALMCLLLSAALLFSILPVSSDAAILGEDYVGSTTVSDRGLNVTEAPVIEADYGILCDSEGTVLWSRGAETHTAMASITKIMTAIVCLESGDLSKTVTVSSNAASVGESSAGLRTGEKITLKTLLKGLLVHSGNDAAIAIAEGVAGSVDAFVAQMNEKATQMGLSDTHFINPTGLDADGHYSSAADICVMERYAMANETFRKIVGKKKTTLSYGGKKRTLSTTNALMAAWDSCIGVKTGYTGKAGQCLASAAVQDGVELYAVVLGCNDQVDRFIDSYKLLDWGFAHYRSYTLASASDVLVDAPMSGFVYRTVKAGVAEDVNACVLDYNGDISVDVKLTDLPDGIGEGDEVGTIVWRQGETIAATAPLVAKESIGAPMPWTSVITAAVRLLGVATGDEGIPESTLHTASVAVEMSTDTAGKIMDAKTESAIRKYVRTH